MTEVQVLFGTESGNAEMVADEVVAVLSSAGLAATITEMSDVAIADLSTADLVVLISSTYGEGGLAASAEPFYEELTQDRPSLEGLRFAAFGLGDKSYENYNNAIDTLTAIFTDLGATQVGETGRHDAESGDDPDNVAVEWVAAILSELQPTTAS